MLINHLALVVKECESISKIFQINSVQIYAKKKLFEEEKQSIFLNDRKSIILLFKFRDLHYVTVGRYSWTF